MHGGRRWLPIRCRECSGCLRLRLVKHEARIAAGLLAADGGRVYVVLSSPLDASWPEVMAWFKRWMKAVRRYGEEQGWGGSVEYAWTKEAGHKNGMKHLNVLMTGWGYIAHSILKSWWVRSSKGRAEVLYVTERVRGGRLDLNSDEGVRFAVRYVSKYVTKEGVAGERMVGYSGGWPRVVEERDECRWVVEGDDVGMAVPPSAAVGVTASGAVVVASRTLVHGPCAAPSEPWESLHLWLYRKARAPGASPLPDVSRSRSKRERSDVPSA